MFNKIKAIKDLRNQAKQIQHTLDEIVSEGSGAWGKVKVKINGSQKMLDISIDDELMQKKDKLVEAIKEAHNDAIKKVQKEMAGKMKDMGDMQEMMKNLGM
jgi:DNA-binding protein YbaB